MAGNLQVKISLDASGYTQGLDDATNSTKEYTNQVKSLTQGLPNLKKEMGQAMRETGNLTLAVSRLTKEQKNSAEGKALIKLLEETKARAAELKDMCMDTSDEIRNMASDTKGLDTFNQAFGLIGNTASAVAGAIGLSKDSTEAMSKAVSAFTTVQSISNALTTAQNALQKQSSLMLAVAAVKQKALTIATNLDTAAKSKNVVAAKAATLAQKAFNLVANANPYVLLATAVAAVGAAFIAFAGDSDEASEAMKKQKSEVEKLTSKWNDMQETIGSASGKMVSDFQTLALQYSLLRTEGEKQVWIKNNASAFENLGLKIMDVVTANKVFIDQLPKMLQLMQKVGEMKGLQDAYAKVQTDYFSWLLTREKSRQTGDFYIKANQQNVTLAERQKLGIGTRIEKKLGYWDRVADPLAADFYYEYSDSDLEKVNKYREKQALETRNAILAQAKKEYGAASQEYQNLYKALYGEVSAASNELNQLIGSNVVDVKAFINAIDKPSSGGTKNPKTGKTTVSKETKATVKKEADKAKQEIKVGLDALEAQAKDLEDKRRKLIDKATGLPSDKNKAEFDKLTQKLTDVNKKIDTANKLLNPETKEEEISTLVDQLNAKIDEYKKEQGKLQEVVNDKIVIKDQARFDELTELIKAKSEQAKQAQKLLDDATTEVIAPEDKIIEEKIKHYQDIIDKAKLQININPELSRVEKAKLQNEMNEAQENLNKWQDAKDQRAVGTTTITPDVVVKPGNELDEAAAKYQAEIQKKLSDIDITQAVKTTGFTDMMSTDEKNLYDIQSSVKEHATSQIEAIKNAFDAGLLGESRAQEFIDRFNEKMKSVGLEPIEVNLKLDHLRTQISEAAQIIGQLSGAISGVFDAFNQLMKGDGEDDKGMMVGKIIAQAVATLALSFAQAMTSASKNWVTWLAFGLTGLAQLVSMTAQIKSLSSGSYAEGGIIPGSRYHGDKLIAQVDAGEMILNKRQQNNLFRAIDNNRLGGPSNKLYGDVTVRGSDLKIALTNYEKINHKSR